MVPFYGRNEVSLGVVTCSMWCQKPQEISSSEWSIWNCAGKQETVFWKKEDFQNLRKENEPPDLTVGMVMIWIRKSVIKDYKFLWYKGRQTVLVSEQGWWRRWPVKYWETTDSLSRGVPWQRCLSSESLPCELYPYIWVVYFTCTSKDCRLDSNHFLKRWQIHQRPGSQSMVHITLKKKKVFLRDKGKY